MRGWMIAAAATLLVGSSALADTLPTVPMDFPNDIDTTLLTVSDDHQLYMSLPRPDAAPAGQPVIWLIMAWNEPQIIIDGKGEDYGGSYVQIDCAGARMRWLGALAFDRNGAVLARTLSQNLDWEPIDPDSIGGDAMKIACGTGQPFEAVLHGVAALQADLSQRRPPAS